MRILIADDDPVSRRMLGATLTTWGHELLVASDGDEAWKVLFKVDRPKLAILDWVMPGMDGAELCAKLRQEGGEPYVYVILLTAKGKHEDVVRGLGAGADDYMTKPFDPSELKVRLRAARRIIDLQRQLMAARDALKERVARDPLTGLLNRSEFSDILQQEVARSEREGTSLAVVMADLDHFKKVNDTYGHLAGDAVLQETALRFTSTVRPYDRIVRYGGEELLFVLPNCARDAAAKVAERLRVIMEREPVDTSEGPIPVTVSLGVAVSSPAAVVPPHQLVKAADAALYRAKDAGRNRIELAVPEDFKKNSESAGHRGARNGGDPGGPEAQRQC